jgi:2,3-bisphosphoglycerate-independent phosphoglycerate mutase
MSVKKKPVALIILDGFGLREESEGNAVLQGKKPNFDKLWFLFPRTVLSASGFDVGLPAGQMGNSEVGHLNIGAGRVVYQDLTRINESITDGSFFSNQELLKAIYHVKEKNSKLHIMGLLSDGGVHSHINHLFALLEMTKMQGLNQVFIHAYTDGRDVSPDSALYYIKETEAKISELGIGQIATLTGRYYAMDRDHRWERVEKAYRAMLYGEGERYSSPTAAIEASYQQGIYDEFILPKVIVTEEQLPVATIAQDDAIIFINFRPDRAIQLSQVLTDNDFHPFVQLQQESDEKANKPSLFFVSMTQYSEAV